MAQINVEEIIATETSRLCKQFNKSFLDCADIVKLTGLGTKNARALMRSKRFPLVRVGRRQVVSILSFVTWQMKESMQGDEYCGEKNKYKTW